MRRDDELVGRVAYQVGSLDSRPELKSGDATVTSQGASSRSSFPPRSVPPSMSIYEDPSFLKGEKDGDGITARSETPAEYIYVPGTAEEKALVRKIDFVRIMRTCVATV